MRKLTYDEQRDLNIRVSWAINNAVQRFPNGSIEEIKSSAQKFLELFEEMHGEELKKLEGDEPVCSICGGRNVYSTSNDNPMVNGAHKKCRDIEQIKLREAQK